MIEAQDRASAQLRQIGGEVARLSQAVASVGGGFGRGLASGISATADAFRILQGVGQLAGQAVGFVADQIRQGFQTNVEIERATIAFQRYTGSAEAAAGIIADLRQEAAVSPFSDQEIIASGRALIAAAGGSRQALLELVRVSEQLAVLDPLQGITGGVVALQESLSGDFTSLSRRFEIPLTMIQRLKDQGVSNLEIVKQALAFRGVDTGSIEAFGRSFEGLQSTVVSFGAELRGLATAGAFQLVGQALGHLVELINRYGNELRVAAQAIGQVMAELGRRVVEGLSPLLRGLDAILPGVGTAITDEFVRPIEAAGHAAEQAAPKLQQLQEATDLQRVTRQLADVGVAAAQLQLEAERVRRGYDDQLRPLERQRDLLRESADLQRVQSALATNRAAVEGMRLGAQVTALQRAARGQEDPNAPGLTTRQRAIALALQEARLRQEELGLTEQQRPALQSLDQQIASLRRQQEDALAPLERSLALRREEADLLQIERTRLQQATDDAKNAGDAFGAAWGAAGGPTPTAQAENKKTIGEQADELAKEWLDRFQKWIDENGGSAWTAIAKSLTEWTIKVGIPVAVQVGREIAGGVVAGIREVLGKDPALDWVKQAIERARAEAPPLTSPQAAAAAGQGGGTTVVVEDGAVRVDGVGDPSASDRLRAFLKAALEAYTMGLAASAGATDPGASARVQGSGRAP